MATQSKLEEIAIAQRNILVAINPFDNADPSQNYTAVHTKALSDNITPVQGKGTGIFMDTTNGGGSLDINGAAQFPGSGRLAEIAANQFQPTTPYQHPDTSANIGQVNF